MRKITSGRVPSNVPAHAAHFAIVWFLVDSIRFKVTIPIIVPAGPTKSQLNTKNRPSGVFGQGQTLVHNKASDKAPIKPNIADIIAETSGSSLVEGFAIIKSF